MFVHEDKAWAPSTGCSSFSLHDSTAAPWNSKPDSNGNRKPIKDKQDSLRIGNLRRSWTCSNISDCLTCTTISPTESPAHLSLYLHTTSLSDNRVNWYITIRDIAKAYCIIPIKSAQWPGLVIRLQGQDTYCINTYDNFRLASVGGIYGKVADAGADIFQAHGIGPLSKWVDDHIFFRIPHEYHNNKWSLWHSAIVKNRGQSQSSQLWYLLGAVTRNKR